MASLSTISPPQVVPAATLGSTPPTPLVTEVHNLPSLQVLQSGRPVPGYKNTPVLQKEHEAVTRGKLRFRFPPEPNGYLHVGHAKAMHLGFGSAVLHNGECVLRYDDTNPEAESEEFIDSILQTVAWMGWKPAKITHASDNFEQLFQYAMQLVKGGQAYVDYSTPEMVNQQRSERTESPWRNRPIEENIKEFTRMRMGYYAEGEAVLRAKIDMKHDNPNMRDFIAYRVKHAPHPKAGKAWCIYPTYDFTHCLCDSIEHIDYSLCTLEFETRRESYFWLLDALNVYRPVVWEFSRLNITGALLSKRKIGKLVNEGIVRGFDDPRLLTLCGLRRRGYTPQAINRFCELVGVTRALNVIDARMLENTLRECLDATVPRRFAVIEPLKVVLTNFSHQSGGAPVVAATAPNHPARPEFGSRTIFLTDTIYIDFSDFRETGSNKKFFGLAPGRTVGLKYTGNITFESFDPAEKTVYCTLDLARTVKPKTNIGWVAAKNAVPVEFRLYDALLTSDKAAIEPDFMQYINVHSETVKHGCVEECMADSPVRHTVQFERIGYFTVDDDARPGKLVLNQTLALVQDRDKQAA